MSFKLISKNNIGIVSVIILAILLSQSKLFDHLTETIFGRIILIAFILLISCTHNFLGLLAVLIVIIAFNHHYENNMVYGYNYYEGFDVSGNVSTDPSGNLSKLTAEQTAKVQELRDKLTAEKQLLTDISGNNSSTTTSSSTTSSTESFTGREGFCMSDIETNMLKGKKSNSIPVFSNSREQSDDVSPSDKSTFSSGYASI